jgi:hypothetical protein
VIGPCGVLNAGPIRGADCTVATGEIGETVGVTVLRGAGVTERLGLAAAIAGVRAALAPAALSICLKVAGTVSGLDPDAVMASSR